jgi:hypothetical protein
VFYKEGIPFIHLPIPPTYQSKNFVINETMNMNNLIDAIKVEQFEMDVKLTDFTTNE